MTESQVDQTPPESPLDVLIIGAGPIGLACAIEAQRHQLSYLVIDKGCIAHSIFRYPTHMRFFSSANLLEIGGVPFITQQEKPSRSEALEYYRRVAQDLKLNVHLYEEVTDVQGEDGRFEIFTSKTRYLAAKVICATGFFEKPRPLGIPGENLPKVTHYYREAHLYHDQDLLITGSGNSAVDAALECYRHGARVTLAIRYSGFHQGIKYWILPDIENRIKSGEIQAFFNTRIDEIRPDSVVLQQENRELEIANDFVLALTGHEPDFDLLRRMGVEIREDEHQTPVHDPETYESNRPGLYLAGVVVGGMCTNKWFIENSRAHARVVFQHLKERLGA